jgi:kynureninase
VTEPPTRADAEALDARDPLAEFRDSFLPPADPDLIYLDGNSLGRPPRATARRLTDLVNGEWGGNLVASWEQWVDLPRQVGDLLGTEQLGARPGEVAVSDATTVNL